MWPPGRAWLEDGVGLGAAPAVFIAGVGWGREIYVGVPGPHWALWVPIVACCFQVAS